MAQRKRITTPADAFNYKPVLLKWPILVSLVIYIAALIAILEYGCQKFPSSNGRRAIPEGWNVTSVKTAVLSAPLVNRRGTPTPKPFISGPATAFATPTSIPLPRPRFVPRRGLNGTAPISSNASMTNSTSGLTFAEKFGYSPYYLNHTRSDNASDIGRRAPDPSHFGQLSGPTQIITVYLGWWPEIGQAYSEIVYFPPRAYYALSLSDDGGPESLHPCWITCDGPAIIFHDTECWNIWARLSAREQEARRLPGMAWRAREIENRAQKCQALRQTPTRDSAFVTYTKVLTLTDPAKGIVVTTTEIDNDWEPTSKDASSTIVPVPVVSGFVTLTDSNGVPTSTSTMTGTEWIRVPISLKTWTDSDGQPMQTQLVPLSDTTVTLTGPTPTPPPPRPESSVSFRNPLITTMTITGKDQSGVPISTFTFVQPILKSTITNSLGEPISTVTLGPTGIPDNINDFGGNKSAEDFHPPQSALFHPMTTQEYYLVSFLPVFLAIVLSILAQVISSSIRILLPFHMMTRPGGVSAQDSIAMSTGGLEGYVNSIRLLFKFGDPVSFMGDLLVLLSATVTSLSGEAVGIKLEGSCTNDSFQGCFMSIAVFKEPSRALEGLLGAMLVVLIAMAFLLNKWKTGISSNPTSVAATASLIQDPSLRRLLREKLKVGESYSDHPRFLRQREVQDRLDGHLFCLGCFRNRDEKDGTDLEEYGITTVKQTTRSAPSDLPLHTFKPSERNPTGLSKARTFALSSVSSMKKTFSSSFRVFRPKATKRRLWLDKITSQPTLDNLISTLGMLLISGLVILVTYYHLTSPSPPTRFEAFMSSQGFGVEALFTSFGVVLSWFWDYYYGKTVMLLPYRLLQVSSTSTGGGSQTRGGLLDMEGVEPSLPARSSSSSSSSDASHTPTTEKVWSRNHDRSPGPLAKEGVSAKVLSRTAPISSVTGFPFSVARGEVYPSAAVGFAAILSKFTPTILSTVPFSPAQTWTMHLVCTWSLIACLGFMGIVVLYGLVFTLWETVLVCDGMGRERATRGGYPYLPVGLESVVGRAWYLCGKESEGVVRDFGKEAVNKGDGCQGKRYIFGEIYCGNGHEIRMGIMRCDEESDYDDRRTGH